MEKLAWHDALYFVGSTLTTVGYGDVVVKSSAGEGAAPAVMKVPPFEESFSTTAHGDTCSFHVAGPGCLQEWQLWLPGARRVPA